MNLRCFNLLRKIIVICHQPSISPRNIKNLQNSISKYLELHKKFYNNIPPKLHYMVHIPDDIIE